jgi:hypothetical protein
MNTFDLRRDTLGICAALGICASAILVGCGGTPGGQTAFSPAQTLVQPQNHRCGFYGICVYLRVSPSHPTIHVNQQRELHTVSWCNRGECHKEEVDAQWSSSGGSLQVIDGGKEAIFSASSPGVYKVVAKAGSLTGRAKVTVTSP